jgi:hypothetical protein
MVQGMNNQRAGEPVYMTVCAARQFNQDAPNGGDSGKANDEPDGARTAQAIIKAVAALVDAVPPDSLGANASSKLVERVLAEVSPEGQEVVRKLAKLFEAGTDGEDADLISEKLGDPVTTAAKSNPEDARLWYSSAHTRSEFGGDFEAFLAFRAADRDGCITISGGKRGADRGTATVARASAKALDKADFALEWARNKVALEQEFADFETFAAFRAAEVNGQVSIG